MVAGGGFQVDPNELHKFASFLKDTTHEEVDAAAKGVHAQNGFDNNAFGIFAAQILAVPARIAMGVVTNNLNGLANEITQAADQTDATANTYSDQEKSTTGSFTSIDPGSVK